jgi:hypothetical protein
MANKIADSPTHFISLVGNTAMGTVQPLTAYTQNIGRPLSIHLLHTKEVESQCQSLADWLKAREYPGLDITTHPIAADLTADDYGPAVTDVYRSLETKLGPLAINAMGGQKHHSLPALTALTRLADHIFLQTLDDGFFINRVEENNLRTFPLELPQPRPIEELLSLQRINYQLQTDAPNNLDKLCRKFKLDLPQNRLDNIIIGGLKWDCLWNPGNNIIHGLMLASPSLSSTPAQHARDIINVVLNKKNLANLYTREFFVLESDVNAHIHLRYEAPHKITSKYFDWLKYDRATATRGAGKEFADFLADIFRRGTATKAVFRELKKVSILPEAIPTLVTAMSSGDPTLLALSTHQCRQAIIWYTPDDEIIANRAHKIKDRASDFGLDNIFLLPATIEGRIRSGMPDNLGSLAQVNVTPGSKGLGLALTIWGLNNGAQLWGIHKDGGRLVRFDGQTDSLDLKPISLKTRLDIMSDASISDYGWNNTSKGWDDPFYDQMLEFMRQLLDAGHPDDFMQKEVELNGFKLKNIPKQGWQLSWPRGAETARGSCLFARSIGLEVNHLDGYWLEKLTGKAIDALNASATGPKRNFEVAVGVSTAKTDRPVQFTKHSPEIQTLTERDVLATDRNGNLYLISCKIRKRPLRIGKLITEIRATATTLGRFTIPLLCTLRTGPYQIEDGVLIFGWDYLCRPNELRRILVLAAQEARRA